MNGPTKDFIRGSINNRPFRPGGLDDSQSLERILPDGATNGEWVRELLRGGPSQTIPPGFKQGLDLGDLKVIYISFRLENHIIYFFFFFCSIVGSIVTNTVCFINCFLKAYPCEWSVCKDQSSPKSKSDNKLVS